MFDVLIDSGKGETETVRCAASRCSLGKARSNLVQLKGWSVEGLHAELVKRAEGIFVVAGKGTGETLVNGDPISGEYGPLRSSDVVGIAGHKIRVGWSGDAKTESKEPKRRTDERTPLSKIIGATESIATLVGVRARPELDEPERVSSEDRFMWRNRVHQKLVTAMDLRRFDVGSLDEEELREAVAKLIQEVLGDMAGELPSDLDQERLAKEVLDEAVGLGPLEDLLVQGDVTEIMVNRFDELYVERGGRLTKSDITFSSDAAVMAAIERIVSPLGRRIDESSPMVDARLKDGSRVNAIIPPLALRGPCLTIRKFSDQKLTDEDLIGYGSVNEAMVTLLRTAVVQRMNIVISGGTGSGKTTLLNILSNFIPSDERIVTVEDAAELKLNQPHIVGLEARPPNLEGKGQVTIRDLVKNCLRMRPDRIVVGECRGGEALDMLQAMNTGHDGSLTTAHANSSRDVLSRLEVMVLMAGMDLPVSAIREQVASAVDLIVQQTRFGDGTRKIIQITEVTGVESGVIQLQDIFTFKQEGFDENGKLVGRFAPTGRVPVFYEELRNRGVEVDMSIFEPEAAAN